MTYAPKPIDTTNITLPGSMDALVEKLAEHNHDIWAQRRIKEGWTYGPERNDTEKKHPDLVAYTELSESEKEYDRASSLEILKAIVSLGYRIEHRGE